jgi:hypothetical protein
MTSTASSIQYGKIAAQKAGIEEIKNLLTTHSKLQHLFWVCLHQLTFYVHRYPVQSASAGAVAPSSAPAPESANTAAGNLADFPVMGEWNKVRTQWPTVPIFGDAVQQMDKPTLAHRRVGTRITYTSEGLQIRDVKALPIPHSHQRAASVRLMLCGKLQAGPRRSRSHSCSEPSPFVVIKCASTKGYTSPSSSDVVRLRREYDMYQEVRRLAPRSDAGCARCYSIDPAGLYMVLKGYSDELPTLWTHPSSPHGLMKGIVSAVKGLHEVGIMHGDIAPGNLLVKRLSSGRYSVKLCDLECAQKVGDECRAAALGTRLYVAPEVRVAAASTTGALCASTAVDMFALGLVLWQVLMHSPTAALNCDSEACLDRLYSDQALLDAHLGYPAPYRAFLERITCLDPVRRLNISDLWKNVESFGTPHFEASIRESHRCDEEVLGTHINTVLGDNAPLSNMFHMLTSGPQTVPSLVFVLPEVDLKAEHLRRNVFRLFFMCSHTKQIALCGRSGRGYKLEVTKQWVQDAAPVLRVGLVLMKAALHGSGLPMPLQEQCGTGRDAATRSKLLDAALRLVTSPADDVPGSEYVMPLKGVASYDTNNLVAELVATNQASVHYVQESYRKAHESIEKVLVAHGHSIALTCGLRRITCSWTGRTAWVLDDDATEQAWREKEEKSALPSAADTTAVAGAAGDTAVATAVHAAAFASATTTTPGADPEDGNAKATCSVR